MQRPGDSRAQEAIPGGRAVRRGRLQARPTGLRVEQGPRGQATALTWSAPPSVVQGGPRELSNPNESLGRVGNAPGNTRPPPLPPGRRSAARPLPPGAPPSSRWLPWVPLLQAGPVGPRVSRSLPSRSPACRRLLLRSPQQRRPGFAWWAPPVKPAGRGWRLSSTLPGSLASQVFCDLGDLC